MAALYITTITTKTTKNDSTTVRIKNMWKKENGFSQKTTW